MPAKPGLVCSGLGSSLAGLGVFFNFVHTEKKRNRRKRNNYERHKRKDTKVVAFESGAVITDFRLRLGK